MDDILRRLGNIETDVSALKVQVGSIVTMLPFLATKADIADLRTELKTEIGGLRAELKSDVADLRTELKTDIGGLRAELKSDIGGLRTEVASLETRIIKWMIATVLTASGVAFSLARFVH